MPSHAHAGPARPLGFQVITVSTTRTLADDSSGAVIAHVVEAAGHAVVGRILVSDAGDAIGAALDAALADPAVDVVVTTGGTGISTRDCTPAVARTRFTREIPGFGELFRARSWEQVGSAAMLSDAVAGVAAGRAIFVLPGSSRACSLAMETLVLPEVAHIAGELLKETAFLGAEGGSAPLRNASPGTRPTGPLTPVGGPGVRPTGTDVGAARRVVAAAPASLADAEILTPASSVAMPTVAGGARGAPVVVVEAPAPPDLAPQVAATSASGWAAARDALGASFAGPAPFALPEALERLAAVHDVLASAGQRAWFDLPNGRRYLAFGFPDLARASSKVLLVASDDACVDGAVEIVALHRWPRRVGACGDGAILPGADADVVAEALARTGGDAPPSGTLVAVEGDAVHVAGARGVVRYDARGASGPVARSSALGSLVLAWSQR